MAPTCGWEDGAPEATSTPEAESAEGASGRRATDGVSSSESWGCETGLRSGLRLNGLSRAANDAAVVRW
eukprot:4487313-Prymnesium_polylepis.1